MGIKDCKKIVAGVVGSTAERNFRLRSHPVTTGIVDVSPKMHQYNVWLRNRKKAEVTYIRDVEYTEEEIGEYAGMIARSISGSCVHDTLYLVFDAKASNRKRRTAEFTDSPMHNWNSVAGLTVIANEYNAVGNSEGPIVRILEHAFAFDWVEIRGVIESLCKKSCSHHLIAHLQSHPWGDSTDRHLATLCVGNLRPPTYHATGILKELCASDYPSWIIVQSKGEADHDIARISAEHEHACIIYTVDSDFTLLTAATDSIAKTSKKAISCSPREFWVCALSLAARSASATDFTLLEQHLAEFRQASGRDPVDMSMFDKLVFGIAANVLASASDYHDGVHGRGCTKIVRAIASGTYEFGTLDSSLPHELLEEWHDHLLALSRWIAANIVRNKPAYTEAFAALVEDTMATVDESTFFWLDTREAFIAACVDQVYFEPSHDAESIRQVITRTLPHFLLMLQ